MGEGMKSLPNRILSEIRAKYEGIMPVAPPLWLARSRWNPAFCMSLPKDSRIVAIDWIPSANMPKLIYREEVRPLKQRHPQLRVVVCVLDNYLDFFPETEAFCREIGCGLQTLIPGVGLQTVVTTDLDRAGEVRAAVEAGWFPQQILQEAANLTNLSFHQTINEFCQKVVPLGDDEGAVTSLVHQTVDRLLEHYPKCHPNVGSFMRLAHFELLFRQVVPTVAEHILHSFRVFLAGCIVINRFYKTFLSAHKHYCVGSRRKMSIEYCWLLTAIFHNVGRPQAGGGRMLEAELEDEDIAVSVVGRQTRWVREEYSEARRILASLGVFIASGPAGDHEWHAGLLPDDQELALAAEWTTLYDQMSSHGVISAFNMLASIVEQARAVNERKNRPFVVTHATPAALAILLHDWRIWDGARKWRLFPVDCGIFPIGALLIFMDTWDDFKRKGLMSPITVESFTVSDAGVGVSVKWLNVEEYEKEKIKYIAFKKALKNRKFAMSIAVKVAGAP